MYYEWRAAIKRRPSIAYCKCSTAVCTTIPAILFHTHTHGKATVSFCFVDSWKLFKIQNKKSNKQLARLHLIRSGQQQPNRPKYAIAFRANTQSCYLPTADNDKYNVNDMHCSQCILKQYFHSIANYIFLFSFFFCLIFKCTDRCVMRTIKYAYDNLGRSVKNAYSIRKKINDQSILSYLS